MNGRCSDDNSEDRLPYNGQLLPNQQQRPTSINSEYSVRNLPPSPSVTSSRSLEDSTYNRQAGFVSEKFDHHSAGGTVSRELEQHHLITSTQEAESRNGE